MTGSPSGYTVRSALKSFYSKLIVCTPTIKFTAQWLYRSVSFLDIKITLNNDGRIITDLYTEPTDTHQYLHRQSCHPRHCKTTIAYGQALRLRRICSLDEEHLWRVGELKLHLVNRGHDEMEIQCQKNRENRISREQAFESSGRKTTNRILLVVTYHPDLPPLSRILRNHLPILHVSDRMKLVAPSPSLLANRRPWNLKDLLTKATVKLPYRHKGSHGCRRPRCKTCAHMKLGTSFTSKITNERFRANVDATCKSSNVVYLIECVKCKKPYVGEMENPLHLWVNGHRFEYYRKLPDKPVASHFNTLGHTFENLTIMVIEDLGSAPTERRKFRERFWIHTLWSVAPQGLNLDHRHRSRP